MARSHHSHPPQIDAEVLDEPRSLADLRTSALAQDALLFCCAFSIGALAFGLLRGLLALTTERTETYWSIGLSQDLVLAGLVAGEIFVLWNNGLRQGRRGHSIGKHREGVAVVDAATGEPTGLARGLVRGLVIAVLLDLAVAALPIGLPTVLRRTTPDAWHVGFATYLALALLLVPLVMSSERRLVDRLVHTKVVETDSRTSAGRGRVVSLLELAGVLGVLVLAISYIAFYSPLIRFPDLF